MLIQAFKSTGFCATPPLMAIAKMVVDRQATNLSR